MPGFILTFSQYRAAVSATLALKCTSATRGVMIPCALRACDICLMFSASLLPCVVRRTSSPPASIILLACCTLASVSRVSVVVIDCTLIGASLPIVIAPTFVSVVFLLCMVVASSFFSSIWSKSTQMGLIGLEIVFDFGEVSVCFLYFLAEGCLVLLQADGCLRVGECEDLHGEYGCVH